MKVQPIAVPTIPVEEIRMWIDDEALIGEGSFGRVYFGVLNNGRSAAIKKIIFDVHRYTGTQVHILRRILCKGLHGVET